MNIFDKKFLWDHRVWWLAGGIVLVAGVAVWLVLRATMPIGQLLAKARVQVTAGDLNQAAATYRQLNIRLPKGYVGHYEAGHVYNDLGLYDAAAEEWWIAINNGHEDYTNVYYELGDLYGAHPETPGRDKFEKYMTDLATKDPKNIHYPLVLGNFYEAIGNTDKAIEYFEKVVALNPNNQAAKDELTRLKNG
ncbi:TPA: hypothetical protein DHW58_01655 [Patescibacteria group bacterium]|uniref:Tetratricopeptide n=2 Tax=Bacteria division Kazan-3B-28 TaxID=1798534 RepID=A0A0G1ZGV4_UNCK3|nr:MAG: Tetratricopeptide [candidate division Kazan bacterium GW2011_GWA1_50_15]KKW25864.1 MAG: Tetratricopeptide [candidate division Kazan bacterium GW2011_GWC1_52_13]KKW27122.1 MAG: Tetratricopeptide [candidate division Kazan bacterium GW2011_GWB1_52_7]HAV66055.1 hypothetical protein [Patescibacteria group bacterium]HCL47675.1 hypothetical protein [Patescibacteria group bacterium]